jgi:hypothetical protein
MTCIGDAPQHVERAVGRRHHGHGVAWRGARADWGERGPGAVGRTVHVAVVERIELFGACAGRPGQDKLRDYHYHRERIVNRKSGNRAGSGAMKMSLNRLQYASFSFCTPGPHFDRDEGMPGKL